MSQSRVVSFIGDAISDSWALRSYRYSQVPVVRSPTPVLKAICIVLAFLSSRIPYDFSGTL